MSLALSPRSLDEAIRRLAEHADLTPVAGCTDLMVTGAARRADMDRVIDLLGIPEIRGIRADDGWLEIGATTTFSAIGRSAEVRASFPSLAQAASVVGGWQIQNRATIGGNVVNASPAGDSLPVLLALDAVAVAVGPSGRRQIPYSRFHVGYRKTALQPGELLGWIRLPLARAGSAQRFWKVGTREAQAISKVVVALSATLEDGRIVSARIAAGSVAPTPVRLRAAEASLAGRPPDRDTAQGAGRAAAEEVTPIDDVRSTAVYRRFALERVVRRMVLSL